MQLVFRDPVLRTITLLSTAVVAVAYPVLGVVLPVIYQAADEPTHLGAVVMAFSLGGIAGALTYSTIGHRAHPRGTFLLSLAGVAGVMLSFAISPTFGVMVGAALVGGALIGPMNPVINLALQRRTSEQMRGRAMGVVVALAYGAYPLGYLLAGGLVEWLGTDKALWVFAVAASSSRCRHLVRAHCGSSTSQWSPLRQWLLPSSEAGPSRSSGLLRCSSSQASSLLSRCAIRVRTLS